MRGGPFMGIEAAREPDHGDRRIIVKDWDAENSEKLEVVEKERSVCGSRAKAAYLNIQN